MGTRPTRGANNLTARVYEELAGEDSMQAISTEVEAELAARAVEEAIAAAPVATKKKPIPASRISENKHWPEQPVDFDADFELALGQLPDPQVIFEAELALIENPALARRQGADSVLIAAYLHKPAGDTVTGAASGYVAVFSKSAWNGAKSGPNPAGQKAEFGRGGLDRDLQVARDRLVALQMNEDVHVGAVEPDDSDVQPRQRMSLYCPGERIRSDVLEFLDVNAGGRDGRRVVQLGNVWRINVYKPLTHDQQRIVQSLGVEVHADNPLAYEG